MRDIMGSIAAIFIVMLLIPMFASYQQQGVTSTKMRHAADHMQQVNHAVTGFVRAHYDTLLAQSTPAAGPELTVQELIDDGQLPAGFGAMNVWGQSYIIYIRQPETDELEAITLTVGGSTAGREFTTATIPSVASMLGGAGGFIPSGLIPGQSTDTLQGAFNGWTLALGTLGISSPGPGHLGARSSFDASSLSLDFLYRMAVPGHEELNSMYTALDMRDHAIRDVGQVQFVDHDITAIPCTAESDGSLYYSRASMGLYLCRNARMELLSDTGNSIPLQSGALVANGDLVDKPVCQAGTTPNIYVMPSMMAMGSVSAPMGAIQAWATSHSDTQWQVHLRVLTGKDTWTYPTANYGRVVAFALCAR